MLKHYVEFLYPGVFVSESYEREIKSRDNIKNIPKNCYGYRFFDREEIVINKENLVGKEKNYSGTYYFGESFTLNEVKKLNGNHKILIDNMKINNWKKVVKTRIGNFQPLYYNDKVLND